MTKSTITDERITSVIERLEHYACNLKWTNVRGAQDLLTAADGLRELQERRKAAMDSKPVFFIEVEGDDWINAGRTEGKNRQDLGLLPDGINYLYAAPQPLTDAEREELQELRRSYLALRGENEDLQAQLYEAESQADDAAEELQERRKADSESVAEVLSNRPGNGTSIVDVALPVGTQLYRHAQPASEREQVRREHAEWSQATFGNVGPVGPLKHLSKEALEAAEQPGDLSEWADMQFLLWDAQRRVGVTDEQITQAMIDKLAVNKQRKWPEPKDGEPRLHIKEQPAPVVQEIDADDNFYSWFGREWRENYQHNQYTTAAKQMLGVMAESAWKAGCRAAMLAAAPQEVPDGK